VARKKKHEEEHENHERWLVSYADFITLLFAFFVVLYSVSRVDNRRMAQAVQSIQWAMHFGGTGGTGALPIFDGPSSNGGGPALTSGSYNQAPQQKAIELLRKKIERHVRPFLMERNAKATVEVSVEGRRLAVRLAATAFFDQGQGALRPQALAILDAIASELVPLERILRIEGHTDETPLGGDRYRNNWELSAARAATVVSYLEAAHHARPELLQAVGLGSAHPLSGEATAEARERNRRVELVIELEARDELRNVAPWGPASGG
jgi:chemotaxis protein MotB